MFWRSRSRDRDWFPRKNKKRRIFIIPYFFAQIQNIAGVRDAFVEDYVKFGRFKRRRHFVFDYFCFYPIADDFLALFIWAAFRTSILTEE